MEADTIEEIKSKIYGMKLVLSSSNLTKEIIDRFEARVEMWETDMNIINFE